ncbi:unnamed protein product [Ixodes pacificus]
MMFECRTRFETRQGKNSHCYTGLANVYIFCASVQIQAHLCCTIGAIFFLTFIFSSWGKSSLYLCVEASIFPESRK